MIVTILSFIGVFLGVLARLFLPYLRKVVKENQKLKWQHRFTGLGIIGLIVTLLVYPSFVPPTDTVIQFCAAFIFGFGFQALISEATGWAAPTK